MGTHTHTKSRHAKAQNVKKEITTLKYKKFCNDFLKKINKLKINICAVHEDGK